MEAPEGNQATQVLAKISCQLLGFYAVMTCNPNMKLKYLLRGEQIVK
jgi:hypothetical protein